MNPVQIPIPTWGADWAWGLPLIVLTVMFHVGALGFLRRRGGSLERYVWKHPTFFIGAVTLYIALLHTLEVCFWAATFVYLKAVPDTGSAMLYSLNAITSYGHTDLTLARRWQLLGAMESLNGWILFGLSAAYLFVVVQTIWSRDAKSREGWLRHARLDDAVQELRKEAPRHFDAGAG